MKKQLMFLIIPVLFLLSFNAIASDVWSGDHEFKGWKGKGDSNPYKNISAASVIRSTPVVTEEELLKKGNIFLDDGEYKKAIKSYEQVIKANQNSAEAYKGIGLAYYKLGYNEHSSNPEVLFQAVSAFEKSLTIKEDAAAYYTLGLSYLALDDKKKAEATLVNLKSINQGLSDTLSAKITAYGAPRNYITVRNPETERRETMEAMQRQEARKREESRELKELKIKITSMGVENAGRNPCPPGYIDDPKYFDNPDMGQCIITPYEEQRRRMEIYNNELKVRGLDPESEEKRAVEKRLRALEYDQRRLKSDNSQLEFEKSRLESEKRNLQFNNRRY